MKRLFSQRLVLALLHSIPISLLILGLFTYWYAVADRYSVFLYEHLGATAFDQVTSSRYWMAGLVASGAVMVLYVIWNWLISRAASLLRRDHAYSRGELPPVWWHVWLLCVMPLAVGIPLITMACNSPVLPPSIATACVAATLAGVALALLPGSWAATRPTELAWIASDGIGLMPILLLLRAVELPSRGLTRASVAYLGAIGGTLVGIVWLGIMTALRLRWHRPTPGAHALFISGLCLSYLLMPLAHHLVATPPGYRYISTATNFFAFSVGVQLLSLSVAAALAVGITRFRRGWQRSTQWGNGPHSARSGQPHGQRCTKDEEA
jgi:hypothetical protein